MHNAQRQSLGTNIRSLKSNTQNAGNSGVTSINMNTKTKKAPQSYGQLLCYIKVKHKH